MKGVWKFFVLFLKFFGICEFMLVTNLFLAVGAGDGTLSLVYVRQTLCH
jgi:hypothetical protein